MASVMLAKSWRYLSKTKRTWFVKKWNISFWNNKSWWNRWTKNSNKNVLKTYFFIWRSVLWCCNQPKSLLSSIYKDEKKNGNKRRILKWVPDVFPCKKRPKKIFKMRQSTLPLDLKKCPQPPNNQPEWFFSARQRKEKRRKIKWKFSSELSVNNDNDHAKTNKNKNQMYLFTWEKKGGKCKMKDMIYPFNKNEKRKKKRKKTRRRWV